MITEIHTQKDSEGEVVLDNGYIRKVSKGSDLVPLQTPHKEESTRWLMASGGCMIVPLLALLGILHMVFSPDDSVVFGGDFNILPGLLFIFILIVSTALGLGTAVFALRTRSRIPHLWIGVSLLTLHLLFFLTPILVIWRLLYSST